MRGFSGISWMLLKSAGWKHNVRLHLWFQTQKHSLRTGKEGRGQGKIPVWFVSALKNPLADWCMHTTNTHTHTPSISQTHKVSASIWRNLKCIQVNNQLHFARGRQKSPVSKALCKHYSGTGQFLFAGSMVLPRQCTQAFPREGIHRFFKLTWSL